ncbi:MAG: hypothetical protein V7722_00745 [Porticoccus sp.]
MSDLLYLSIQYIRYHSKKLFALILAITLVSWLPIGIQSIVNQTADQLLSRAEQTPLIIGASGSPLELSLGSLYFRSHPASNLNYSELQKVEEGGLATAIPLYFRFHAQGHPIVGTSPDYLDYRKLRFSSGRPMALLGEAILGAEVARVTGLKVGDYIISSPESVFDIAGVYPLKMPVVGILVPSLSPDDKAVFVDIKTSWVIEGLGHGHQDLNNKKASRQILKKEGNNIVANASVRQYNEITKNNLESFHFHGNNDTHPLSAIIPIPKDKKSSTLLLGRYLEENKDTQIVRSKKVIGELLDTVFTVRDYIVIGVFIIALSTAAIALLVFYLSLQLRQAERFTLSHIGAGRIQIYCLMATEVITVLLISVGLSALLTLGTQHFGIQLLQTLLLT